MKDTKLIDVHALQEEARNSEHKESYRILERNPKYRIGIGARQVSSSQPIFFIEVLVNMCPNHSQVDLFLLEKELLFLKEVQSRGYSLSCQGDSYVACEISITPQNLATEYDAMKQIVKRTFQLINFN